MMLYPFPNRRAAGRMLASRLMAYAGRSDVLVLALPRGGVPVAFEVAQALHARLDVCLVRKLGVPGHQELALGAIASGGTIVLNTEVVEALNIPDRVILAVAADEQRELERREQTYRDGRPAPQVQNQTVLLVDDGLATGATMRAAAAALRQQAPARLIIAVPVAPPSTCEELQSKADEIVCFLAPDPFFAVGYWYEDFTQTTDEEVRTLLTEGADRHILAVNGQCNS